MSKSKIVGIMALMAFVMAVLLVGNAVAGEKFKWRAVWYTVKAESVNVPREEGRVLNMQESKGILTVLEGSKKMDGMSGIVVGIGEANTKTGTGSGRGEIIFTDRDGDKICWAYEMKREKGNSGGPATILNGTGKFEGLKGKAIWSAVTVAPNQFYVDWEGEFE